MAVKRRMDIEAALQWAYRVELPKRPPRGPDGHAPGWGSVENFGELLTVVDRFGVVPDFAAQGEPDPDAREIARQVQALDEEPRDPRLSPPDLAQLVTDFGDMGEPGAEALARAAASLLADGRMRRGPTALVVGRALLGGCPDWEADAPRLVPVRHWNGAVRWFRKAAIPMRTVEGERIEHVVEVDGFDERRRRPCRDAYQKLRLEPDPAPAIVERAEYAVWHAALGVLVDQLAGQLAGVEVTPSPRAARPWLGDTPAPARVLPNLLEPPARPRRAARRS